MKRYILEQDRPILDPKLSSGAIWHNLNRAIPTILCKRYCYFRLRRGLCVLRIDKLFGKLHVNGSLSMIHAPELLVLAISFGTDLIVSADIMAMGFWGLKQQQLSLFD